MRVVLDESVPRQLAPLLTGHDVTTVQKHGWAGLQNGELMGKAAAEFGAFITGDRNLEFQQNYAELDIGLIVLVVPNNRVETVTALAGPILSALARLQPGQVLRVAT